MPLFRTERGPGRVLRAKEYFHTVARAEREISLLQAKLRHYEDMGLSISGTGGSGPSGGGKNRSYSKVEAVAVSVVDLTADLMSQLQRYKAIVTEAERIIKAIPQEKYRQILTYRYLCGWTFRSISDELRYSDPKSVYRAHGWALMEAQKILNKHHQGQPAPT